MVDFRFGTFLFIYFVNGNSQLNTINEKTIAKLLLRKGKHVYFDAFKNTEDNNFIFEVKKKKDKFF